ncbi:MAG TPA: acyl-CoA dehydrogenase family protein [Armatimonadaceae bacterium]|nr:acyl-CoA dehydrogenase family protein [Armatimonadaceae bacterium]
MENAAELESPAAPTLTEHELTLLARARRVADTVLEPNAERYDATAEFPFANLDALAAEGLVGVTTPPEWGGHGTSGAFQREYVETLTAACGTTWFILTQHLGACAQIASSENPSLRERFLRDMAAGRHYVGVGFGHLRRPTPMLRARRADGGWVLDGVAPWVTGWPALKGVIYGAVLEDGERHLYAYAPADHPAVTSSPPLPQCAMNAAATTEVRLNEMFVPDEDFVKFSSRAEMAKGDERGIAGTVAPPLGCAVGSLRALRATAEKRKQAASADAAEALAREIDACRAEARRWADGPKDTPEYKPNALNARAWAIELGVRAAHMTVAAASGAANALSHPAQRRFREAMFYTVTAQTADIQSATLERLSR